MSAAPCRAFPQDPSQGACPVELRLAMELASARERLVEVGYRLVELHEMGDEAAAAEIRSIMSALLLQEKALASLVSHLEKKAWGEA